MQTQVQVLFILIPLLAIILINLPIAKKWRELAFYFCGLALVSQMILTFSMSGDLWQMILKPVKLDFSSSLGFDAIGLVVLFAISLIALISLLAKSSENGQDDFNFINLLLTAVLGMNGVVLVKDLFTLYVFLEATAISSFILIAMDKKIDSFEGAFKYYVMSALATIMMLSSIGIIFLTTNDLNYSSISLYLKNQDAMKSGQIIIATILFTAGLAIKAGIIPFHGWLPDAYSSAPSAVSILLAGIVTKVAGVYTLMRLNCFVFQNIYINKTFMLLGAISIVVGALAAIGQKDFKRMLAYSSISQVGYIILGFSCMGSTLALLGAVFHFFNHATFKSLLFVNSSMIERQTGTRDIDKLGGLAAKMPITGGSSVIAFLSAAGIPPLAGFWSKLMIILGLWFSGFRVYAIIALLASLLTLAYFLILQRKVFFGKLAIGLENIKEGNFKSSMPAVILSMIILAVGLLFPLLLAFTRSVSIL